MSDSEDQVRESTSFLMPGGQEVSNDPTFNAKQLLEAQAATVAATPHTGTANPVSPGANSASAKQRKADKKLRNTNLVTNADPDDDGDDDGDSDEDDGGEETTTAEADDDYDTMSVNELEAEIRGRNKANETDMPTTGKKAELIARLREDDKES